MSRRKAARIAGKTEVWKVPATPKKKIKGVEVNNDGTPTYINLTRWGYDRALRGALWNKCCDCGLEHLLTFEVFKDGDGSFFLVKRAYRNGKP